MSRIGFTQNDPNMAPIQAPEPGTSTATRAKVKTQVNWQLTEIVYQQQTLGMLSGPFIAATVGYLVWDEIPRNQTMGWLILFGVVIFAELALCGTFLIMRHRGTLRSPRLWQWLHFALTVFEALPLVISGALFLPNVSSDAQIGLIGLNAGVAAIGTGLFVANLPAAIAYGVTIMTGTAVGLFMMGSESGQVMGAMCMIYLAFLSFSAVEYHRIVYNAVSYRRRAEMLSVRLRGALSSVRKAETNARAKTYFLSRIGHEMRTPMHRVIGNGELLRQMSEGELQSGLCDDLLDASKEMMRVIDNVLDYTNVVSGNLKLATDPITLAEVANEAVETVQSAASEKKLDVRLHMEHDLPDAMEGDSQRIRQILENLVDNAVRFTETGSVDIKISKDTRGAAVRFSVCDTGIGIDPDLQKSLFSPAFQVGDTRPRQLSGTGLSLAICRELVEMMNGTISAESTPGEGSTFWFDLPLEPLKTRPSAAA